MAIGLVGVVAMGICLRSIPWPPPLRPLAIAHLLAARSGTFLAIVFSVTDWVNFFFDENEKQGKTRARGCSGHCEFDGAWYLLERKEGVIGFDECV